MVPFRQASMERVRRELRNVTVKQIGDRNHMTIGLQQPDAVAATIREFLLTRQPGEVKTCRLDAFAAPREADQEFGPTLCNPAFYFGPTTSHLSGTHRRSRR